MDVMTSRDMNLKGIDRLEARMNRLTTIGITFIFLVATMTVYAAHAFGSSTAEDIVSPTPVLVVSGTITDAQGNTVSAGLHVQVTNEDRQLTANGTTDADGKYIVTLVSVDIQAELIAAGVGEIISVTIQKPSYSKSYELTAEDIRAAHVTIDVTIPDEEILSFTAVGGKPASPTEILLFEVDEGSELRLKLAAAGGSGNTLTYSASSLPTGATIEDDVFVWTPWYDTVTYDEGQRDFDVTLTVSDGASTASQPIRIRVSYASNAKTVTVMAEKEINGEVREISELAAIPDSIATIKVTIKDANEQFVTDESVKLSLSPQMGSLSEVTNVGNGTFIAQYTASVDLGGVEITATTSNNVQDSVFLTLVPGPPASLQLTVEPLKLFSGETAALTIQVTDRAGHPIADAQIKLSRSPEVGELSSVIAQGNGSYAATYTAGSSSVTLTASVETTTGEVITDQKEITVVEREVSPAHSSVELTSPIEAGKEAAISITLRDKDSNPVPGRKVSISVVEVAETIETEPTDEQGQIQATIKAINNAGFYTISILVLEDGPTLDTQSLEIIPGLPYRIELDAPESMVAGESTTLSIRVFDRFDNLILDAQIKLSRSPEVGELSSVIAQGNGSYAATYTAGSSSVTLTASVETTTGEVITDQKEITVVEREVSPAHSSVELTSPIEAGKEAAISITLRDKDSNPVPGRKVSISVVEVAETIETEPTDEQGQIQATIKAINNAGFYTISILVLEDGPTLDTQSLEIIPGLPYRIELDAPESMVAGESTTLSIRVFDRFDNLILDAQITLSFPPEVGTLSEEKYEDGVYTATYTMGDISVELTATAGEAEVKKMVYVVPPDELPPASLELEVHKKLERSESFTLSIKAFDSSDNPVSGAEIQMKTNLGTVTSPADRKGNGNYSAIFRSEEVGTAKIEAFIEGGPSDIKEVQVVDSRAIIYSGTIQPQSGKAGDSFFITAEAEANGKMTFSISGVVQKHLMSEVEVSPGIYEGTYQVPLDIEIEETDLLTILHLTDAYGNIGELTLEERITIDTIGPIAPKNLQVHGINNPDKVTITASATSGRTVLLWVNGIKKVSKVADYDGQVAWELDLDGWEDGEYLFELAEEPDALGNPGKIARRTEVRDTRPPEGLVKILSPRFSPMPPIPYNTRTSIEVTVVFFEQSPKSLEVDIILKLPKDEKRIFSLPLRPDEPSSLLFLADAVGTWECEISWPGDENHPAVRKTREFEVEARPGRLEIEVETEPQFIKPGYPIAIAGKLIDPADKADQKIQIQIMRPETGAWELLPDTFFTLPTGDFGQVYTPDQDGVWRFRAVWDGMKDKNGNVGYTRTLSPDIEATVLFPYGRVIIVVGGDSSLPHWDKTFFKLGMYVYKTFLRRGFPEEGICFLSPRLEILPSDREDYPISDYKFGKEKLEKTIFEWGIENLSPDENLYIYLLSDNLGAGFILESGVHGVERLSPDNIDSWLDELNSLGKNVVLVMESCYSGEYIQPSKQPLQARRVVITSSDARTPANIIRTDSFSRRFFNRLDRRQDFRTSFEETTKGMEYGFRNRPQVDANGNGIPNEREDYTVLSGFYLGNPAHMSEGDAPNITNWDSRRTLAKGVREAIIEAFIKGGGIEANAIVYAPGYQNIPQIESWESLDSLGYTVELIGTENTGYRGSYDGFTEPGTYTIFIYAENIDGSAVPIMTTVTVPNRCDLSDVNSDGVINIYDLAAVALQYGQIGPDLVEDVNGDGIVDISDLMAVAQCYGGNTTIAAPPNARRFMDWPTPREISSAKQALAALEELTNPSYGVQIAIESLRTWLAAKEPVIIETKLLNNYPNPFNPETWIPYQLAVPADVTIRIYNISGQLICSLELGRQAAGFYVGRSRAAYWNGRNMYGESVTSGVYFVVLKAGEYQQARRIVLTK